MAVRLISRWRESPMKPTIGWVLLSRAKLRVRRDHVRTTWAQIVTRAKVHALKARLSLSG